MFYILNVLQLKLRSLVMRKIYYLVGILLNCSCNIILKYEYQYYVYRMYNLDL